MRSDQTGPLAPTRLPFPMRDGPACVARLPQKRAVRNHEVLSPAKQQESPSICRSHRAITRSDPTRRDVAVLITVPRRVDGERAPREEPHSNRGHLRAMRRTRTAQFGVGLAWLDMSQMWLRPTMTAISLGTSTDLSAGNRGRRALRPRLIPFERVSHRQLAHPVLEKDSDPIDRTWRALGHAPRAGWLRERPRRPMPHRESREILGSCSHIWVTSS